MGANKKKKTLECCGIINCLAAALRPSANGCIQPNEEITSGPTRLCIIANSFLSAKVYIATVIKMNNIVVSKCNNNNICLERRRTIIVTIIPITELTKMQGITVRIITSTSPM